MKTRTSLQMSMVLLASIWASDAMAQGLIIPGAGAVNRSMAGASTAAPLDAAGAAYWNPAAISGLPHNEVLFGAEMLYADIHLASRIGPGPLSGKTFSDGGLATVPTISMVYHPEDSPCTFGMGIFALAGGSVNFPVDAGNPILAPFAPGPSGFGSQYSNAAILQIAPIASVWLTERLAVGAGPMIDYMTLQLDPAFFAAPNPDGSFPPAMNGRPFWGGGFQVGAYFEPNSCWSLGLSYKSPQWFETLKYNSYDNTGAFREVSLDLTLPWIMSLGVAYKGLNRTTIATDVRYFDYAGADMFGDAPPNGTGWENIFSVAIGAQYELTKRTTVRMGYLYNENPIPEPLTLFNAELPAIGQHQLTLGGSTQMSKWLRMDMAVIYSFENSITGPIAQVPASAVMLEQEVISLAISTAVVF